MASTSARGVVTVSTLTTMRLVPSDAVAGSAMIALPPGDALAPRTKSSCPPMAPIATPFSVSELTLPSSPTWSAELIATSRLIRASTFWPCVYDVGRTETALFSCTKR